MKHKEIVSAVFQDIEKDLGTGISRRNTSADDITISRRVSVSRVIAGLAQQTLRISSGELGLDPSSIRSPRSHSVLTGRVAQSVILTMPSDQAILEAGDRLCPTRQDQGHQGSV